MELFKTPCNKYVYYDGKFILSNIFESQFQEEDVIYKKLDYTNEFKVPNKRNRKEKIWNTFKIGNQEYAINERGFPERITDIVNAYIFKSWYQ